MHDVTLLAQLVVEDYLGLVDDSYTAVLPHAVRVLAELGVPEHLRHGPATAPFLADAVGADAANLARLMRALASVGIVTAGPDGYALTPVGRRLLPDEGDVAVSVRNTDSVRAWLHAVGTVRGEGDAFATAHARDFFGHKDASSVAELDFARRMRERARRHYTGVPAAVDWSQARVVMDVGGGDGFLLERVLRVGEHLTGVLFDRPTGGPDRPQDVGPCGLEGRWSVRRGDFFEALPPGADVHLMSSVLHDWSDEQAVRILRASRAALEPGGVLLVVEMLVPQESGQWHPSLWSDLGMMVLTGGRERTRAEFEAVLAGAGYGLVGVSPVTGSAFSVLHAQ